MRGGGGLLRPFMFHFHGPRLHRGRRCRKTLLWARYRRGSLRRGGALGYFMGVGDFNGRGALTGAGDIIALGALMVRGALIGCGPLRGRGRFIGASGRTNRGGFKKDI